MLTPQQLSNYADALVWGVEENKKKGPFEPRSIFLIRTDLPALPLAETVYGKLLDMGHYPQIDVMPTENHQVMYYEKAQEHHLDFVVPWWKDKYSHVRGSIYIHAPLSLTHLKDVDPEKQQRRSKAMTDWRKFLDSQEEKGLFSWTLCVYPTEELAKKAGMTLWDYRDQICKACYLDMNNTINDLRASNDMINKIKEWLNKLSIDLIHVEADGLDLKLKLGKKRQWVGGGGANIPSFEIFTSPDCTFTNGVYYADQPTYHGGKLVEDIRLEFKDGHVVSSSASASAEYLQKVIETDEGSSAVGEFSLTDKRISKIDRFMADTLFDENYGGEYGNCHIAVGCSYTEAYDGDPSELTEENKKALGFNDSVVHWDLVNTKDKRVTATLNDGSKRVIYESGMFTY